MRQHCVYLPCNKGQSWEKKGLEVWRLKIGRSTWLWPQGGEKAALLTQIVSAIIFLSVWDCSMNENEAIFWLSTQTPPREELSQQHQHHTVLLGVNNIEAVHVEAEEAAHLTQLASVFYYSYHEKETKMYAKKEPGDLF